jgi:hypothetical protein
MTAVAAKAGLLYLILTRVEGQTYLILVVDDGRSG